jgi:hypothetical protein
MFYTKNLLSKNGNILCAYSRSDTYLGGNRELFEESDCSVDVPNAGRSTYVHSCVTTDITFSQLLDSTVDSE